MFYYLESASYNLLPPSIPTEQPKVIHRLYLFTHLYFPIRPVYLPRNCLSAPYAYRRFGHSPHIPTWKYALYRS